MKYFYSVIVLLFLGSMPLHLLAQQEFLDPTFGEDGIVITAMGTGFHHPYKLIILDDNRIVVLGSVEDSVSRQDVLLGYNANGSVDDTFGEEGVVLAPMQTVDNGYWSDMVVTKDGNLLLAGSEPEKNHLFFQKYTPHGKLVPGFGNQGTLLLDTGMVPVKMYLQEDGSMLLLSVLWVDEYKYWRSLLLRLNEDMSRDTLFRMNKRLQGELPFRARVIQPQSDGKIVLGGMVFQHNASILMVDRLLENGVLDTAFGKRDIYGQFAIAGAETGTGSAGMGGIVAKEDALYILGTLYSQIMLAKLDVQGTIDSSFGSNGLKFLSRHRSYGRCISEREDGMMLISGSVWDDVINDENFLIMQVDDHGSPDLSFGNDGVIEIDLSNGSDYGVRHVVQPDGKIVVLGGVFGDTNGFGLIRTRAQPIVGNVQDEVVPTFIHSDVNVVDDEVRVSVDLSLPSTIRLSLVATDGNVINSASFDGLRIGTHRLQLQIPEDLPPGVYILSISDGRSELQGIKLHLNK